MTLKTADGRLYVVSGASRCGKTTQVAKETNPLPRICAWDPEDQYAQLPGYTKVTSRRLLFDALTSPGRLRIAYVSGGDLKEDFDYWCGVVYYACRYVAPLAAIGEEIADVTTQSKAPGNWGILVRRGLKRGLILYAISQRWSEADKTCIGNASEYIVFTSRPKDRKYVSDFTGLAITEIDAIKPFHFIRIDPVTKEKVSCKLPFA